MAVVASPLVYIVILNYRNYSDTIECVRSVEKISYPNFRVVIVDNGSDNDSEEILRTSCPGHVVIQTGRNAGYAAGNNVGIRRGMGDGAEFILVLNNDTIVEPDFLSHLVDYAAEHSAAGLLGPLIRHPDGEINRICTRRSPRLREIFWNRGIGRWLGINKSWARRCLYEGEYFFDEPREVEVLSGSCMLFRASLISLIGLLDENTFLFWEEFILYEKMRETRFKTVVVPRSRVMHKGGRSIRTISTRAALADLRSLNYYLRRYRGVGPFRRAAMMLSATAFFLPGILKTVSGARKLEARLKSRPPEGAGGDTAAGSD